MHASITTTASVYFQFHAYVETVSCFRCEFLECAYLGINDPPPSSFLYIHHQVTDLHRHKIDHIAIPSSRGPEFGVLKRVEDVRPLNPCFSIMFLYLHSHFKSIYTFLP